jgi:hypothetical protein
VVSNRSPLTGTVIGGLSWIGFPAALKKSFVTDF